MCVCVCVYVLVAVREREREVCRMTLNFGAIDFFQSYCFKGSRTSIRLGLTHPLTNSSPALDQMLQNFLLCLSDDPANDDKILMRYFRVLLRLH